MTSLSTLKGAIGEADAIVYYTQLGYTVSIPFATTEYDLVIERDGQFQRVQCKYTSKVRGYSYVVDFSIRRNNGTRRLRNTGFDILYCLCPDGSRYIVPADSIAPGREKRLLAKYLVLPALPKNTEALVSRCRRCNKSYEGPFAVCDKCRERVAEHQRQYRALKREQAQLPGETP